MPVISCRSWPILAVAGGALLVVSACAPNQAVQPRLDPSLSGAEREDSRYGTLLRLASSARAAGDPAAAVKIYQQAIALDRGRTDAHVLLGDTLIELKALRRRRPDLRGRAEARRRQRRRASRLRPRDARPQPAGGGDRALPGGARAATRTTCRPTTGSASRSTSPVSTRRPRPPTAPASRSRPTACCCATTSACRWRSPAAIDESIQLLRAVVDEPGAKASNRQNLALAYGLAGDLVAAERISRLDLDEEAVQNNLAYYAALAAVDDRRKRAAALGVNPPELSDDAGDAETGRRLSAIALEGNGLELGLAPTGRWFVNLGDYGSARQAASAWRQLRSQHDDLLGDLSRLAGVQDGEQPLLVGPLADAERAQSLCGSLRGRGQNCRALAL